MLIIKSGNTKFTTRTSKEKTENITARIHTSLTPDPNMEIQEIQKQQSKAEQQLEETKKQLQLQQLRTQYQLGMLFFKGVGTEKNLTQAFRLFRLAADPNNDNSSENGFAIAQFKLVMYEYGKCVPQSDADAIQW